jgi:uncharacterized protein (TIGR03435 family)
MKILLTEAYGSGWDEVIGPSWIGDPFGPNIYVVDATMPPGTTKEQFRLMMQNLLKSRFRLAVHHEKRDLPGYELVVSKGGPKLKPTGTLPKDSPPIHQTLESARYEARGWSMADLTRELGRMISESLGDGARPRVHDATGLTGTFDFRLEYSCFARCGPPFLPPGAPGFTPPSSDGAAPGQPAHPAPETSGARLPSIMGALEEQLGLKLVKAKGVPVDVLVVDHVDKEPTEN